MQTRTQYVRSLIAIDSVHEAMRERHIAEGKTILCMASELSGGFHPYSQFCPQCPRAVECARSLAQRHGFDVAALRRADLTAVPKRVWDVIG